ncbi:MAG: SRPBCC family protein [Gemmatimonadales bacterium]
MSRSRTSLVRTSDRELVWTRTFGAPAAIVFDAYTKPEYVRRWWAPKSRSVTMLECDVDLRPGGSYRYVLGRGDSERFAFFGKYLEVGRPTRLVYTQTYEPFPDLEAVLTVSFEERDGVTTLVAHERYPSKQALDGALASGMAEGARDSFEELAELVASLPHSATTHRPE